MRPSEDLARLKQFFIRELLDNSIPWWMEHAIDRDNGGVCTFIEDDGTILSTDKYMWSQLRALYTWSALCNRIERRPEWLEVATSIYEFVQRAEREPGGEWAYVVDKDGHIVEGADSIYSDGFAIMGMTEYARATGEQQAIDTALQTYQSVVERLRQPGSYGTEPYVIPEGGKAHGISMIFSNVFWELGKFLGRDDIMAEGYNHALQVMEDFRRPEKRCLLEFVGIDGKVLDVPAGQVINPGHAIESMWFQMHIFADCDEREQIADAIECIRWHLELGWDQLHGGILLAVDSEGAPEPAWKYHDSKWWWVHTEAMYALLLAYLHSHEGWCLDWYDRVHEWAFAHYPCTEHGEWRMQLERDGSVPKRLISNFRHKIKDPFHLPRAWMLCIAVLEALEQERQG